MPPARKAIALLLTYPALASEETDHETWLTSDEDDCQMLGRLLKLLHERAHYNLSHIIGYWRGTYGEQDTDKLAAIAGHDLFQAADALSKSQQNNPEKASYDMKAAFCDCIVSLKRLQNAKINAASLAKLKNADLTQLSKEERAQLVGAILADKTIH